MKNIIVIISLIVVVIALGWVLVAGPLSSIFSTDTDHAPPVDVTNIKSFKDCEDAGFPVRESYPRQCALPDGRLYTEEIVVKSTYKNADADMIRIETPHAGGVVGKEFVATGEARGNWFFEASFPIDIVGENGSIIGGSFATAEGDWMTTDFVRFKSEIIDLPSAYTGPAWLVLKKDNPSGLPENDASMWVPIVVEY